MTGQKYNSKGGYLEMELLRFTTAGSVDDGKSTLIGRLLYDSKSIFEDQMESVIRASEQKGEEYVNLALLTDGLKAEREQGITIDVAYRYFATPKRKFIIADTPGHIQYTRNMVTGASTANLAIILIDARKGVIEQTKRHTIIASMLGIPHIAVCINKMDLVNFDEDVYNTIKNDFIKLSENLDVRDLHFIPISALKGDNVVDESENMSWYKGESLLHLLENIPIVLDKNLNDFRMPVQYVIRPQSTDFHDYRGYSGKIAGGVLHTGDMVKVLPSGLTSKVKSIDDFGIEHQYAFTPMSVVVRLEDEIDISRGDMLVHVENTAQIGQDFEVNICWMSQDKLVKGGKYLLKHTSNEMRCLVKDISYKIDVNTSEEIYNQEVGLNDIARISIKTTRPI
jgi:sulfate adenylyltransferase subunit 1